MWEDENAPGVVILILLVFSHWITFIIVFKRSPPENNLLI